MKTLILALTIFYIATAALAADLSEANVRAFLDRWLAAQNTGSFSDYADMYAKDFTGTRKSGDRTVNLDHDGWVKERKKMFKKKMSVAASNVAIEVTGNKASARFVQTWSSGSYRDTGEKAMVLVNEGSSVKIAKEVMVSSNAIRTEDGQKTRRVTTSLLPKDCKPVSSKYSRLFGSRHLEREECPAPKGWRLFMVVGGEYYWLEVGHGESLWSTEAEVVTNPDHRFGSFQSVHFSNVEWLLSGTDEPDALIFPVSAQDPETFKNTIRYFVIHLGEKPAMCGTADSLKKATAIAYDKPCGEPLPMQFVKGLAQIR